MSLLEDNPGRFWMLAVFGWFAASMAYRQWIGKPLFASARPDATFSESWASARVGTGLLARLGTAKNCMHVQAAGGHLILQPHFPISLGFMPEIYNLDHSVPLNNIRSIRILTHGRLKTVAIEYTNDKHQPQVMQLLLRNAEAFVRACHSAQADA